MNKAIERTSDFHKRDWSFLDSVLQYVSEVYWAIGSKQLEDCLIE